MLSTPWSLRWTSICKSWGPPLLVACSLSPRLRFLEHNNIVQFPYLLLSNSQTLLSSLSKIVLVDTSFAFLRCSFLANTLQLRETIISRNCFFFFSDEISWFSIRRGFWLLLIPSFLGWRDNERERGRRRRRRRSCCVRLCCEGSGCVSDERERERTVMRGGGNGQRLRGRQEKRSLIKILSEPPKSLFKPQVT